MSPRTRQLLPVLVVLSACLAVPAMAGATVDIGIGTHPDVVADPDGNAYVSWTEEDRGAQDVVHVCRIAAGQSACDRSAEWTYPGSDTLTSAIVRDPGTGEVHVVIHRAFGTEGGTFVATSADDGVTYAAPRRPAVFPEQWGLVLVVTLVVLGGIAVVVAVLVA